MYPRILRHIILPLLDLVEGGGYLQKLKQLSREVHLSEGELFDLQRKRLEATLEFAQKNSPFYKTFERPNSKDPISWLKEFPILTKSTLKERGIEIPTQSVDSMIKMVSSGSSGVQSTIYLTKEELYMTRAIQSLWWGWAGWKMGEPTIQTGLSFQRTWFKKVKDILFRTRYILAFDHREEEILDILKWAEKRKEITLAGYASSLFVISQIAQKHGIHPHFSQAITWGDKLFSHYRKSISENFSTKVYETYGTTEGMMMGAQKDLDHLYFMQPLYFLEILDEKGRDVPDGEMGRVVVTNLFARGFPLIRYEIGDLAIMMKREDYPLKRDLQLPIIQKVVGRNTDIVRTPSGRSLIVHSFTGIFEFFPQIRQFRIIQNEVEGVTVEIIPEKEYSPELEANLKKKLLELIQEPFEIRFEKVDHIPPTASGKPQIIQSSIPYGQSK